MVDLDPWLSTLDTTSINPNINTSKTQTVSDNKPAAPVLINGRNVEKLREKHQMCQHNQMLPVYVSIDISSKQVISRSRYIFITWLSYREVEEMVVERLVNHRLQLETASECLLVFLTRLYLSQTYIFDVRLAHFQLCLWSQNSCFGSWTKSEQKSQCFKKLRLKIAAKKTVVGGNQRWWEKDSGALWSGTHQWNKAEETAVAAQNRFLQAKENLEHQQGSGAELLQVTRTARCGFTSQRAAED